MLALRKRRSLMHFLSFDFGCTTWALGSRRYQRLTSHRQFASGEIEVQGSNYNGVVHLFNVKNGLPTKDRQGINPFFHILSSTLAKLFHIFSLCIKV